MKEMDFQLTRRTLLASLTVITAFPALAESDINVLRIFKSPTCGCCSAWAEHMRHAGFDVHVKDVDHDTLQAIKVSLSIPPRYMSCHTAQTGSYFVEGHVPADDVKRLLQNRPVGLGLAVPGMPIGSPGMEMGDRVDPYDVLLISSSGTAQTFQRHG